MNEEYREEPEARWELVRAQGGDGYDAIEAAGEAGWRAVPGWGAKGWDLGSWPYVVVFTRKRRGASPDEDRYELVEYVEGDVTKYAFPTAELRSSAIDELAFWHWQHSEAEWVAGIATAADAPAELRGAFSWSRAEAVS